MVETRREEADRAFKSLTAMNREELVEVVAQVTEQDLHSSKEKLDQVIKLLHDNSRSEPPLG